MLLSNEGVVPGLYHRKVMGPPGDNNGPSTDLKSAIGAHCPPPPLLQSVPSQLACLSPRMRLGPRTAQVSASQQFNPEGRDTSRGMAHQEECAWPARQAMRRLLTWKRPPPPPDSAFGSLDEAKSKFNAAAAGRFGSGWAWLSVGGDGNLFISSTANQVPRSPCPAIFRSEFGL